MQLSFMYSATTAGAPGGDLDEMAVLVVDAHGAIITAEAACARYFGGSRKDLLGRNFRDAVGSDRIDPYVRRAMEGYAARLDTELRGRTVRFHFAPRVEKGGALIIAHELPFSEPLPGASTYLQTMLDQAPGGVWATDKDLRITFFLENVYAAGVAAVGQTLQEFVGTSDPNDITISHHIAALAGDEGNFRVRLRGRVLQKKVKPLRSASGDIIGTIGACVDVTDWAATEDELAKAKWSLDAAQRVAHVGSFEWDPERGLLTCSDEMCRIYAIVNETSEGPATLIDRIHPDDLPKVRATLLRAYRTTEPVYFDHRIVRPTGEIRTLHCRVGAVRHNGTPVYVAGTCWDQTELTKARNDLEHNISLLEGIIDATADGILVVDRAGKVTTFNRQFITLWRIPPELVDARQDEELLGHVIELIEDSGSFFQRVRELYEQPEEESFDLIHLKDGRVFERKSIPQRIRSVVVGRVWSFRDVTGREQRLRSALFLNDATRLLSSLDEERALQAIARLSVPYLGQVCTIDLVRGDAPRRFTAVVNERDTAPLLHAQVLEGHQLEYKVGSLSHLAAPLTRDRSVLGAITLVAQPSRTFSEWEVGTVAELARRISYAISDHHAQREARDALNARDDFLGIVAHELRGPLASIHLSAQRLAKGGLTPAAQNTFLATIAREDRRLERLLEEIVDLERARTGQLHISLERVDLAEVTAAVVARLGPEINKSGSSVTTQSNGPAAGQWDRLNLERVIDNLLRNALKFGLGRPISIAVDGATNGAATIVVEDHGTGIPVAMREKIFRPFERAVSSRYYGGLGLGLFVANAIVTALGGNIHVDSEEGAGSRFTVVLPRTGGD